MNPNDDITNNLAVNGLTLRDYFAAAALANPYTKDNLHPGDTSISVAMWAYRLADAMLKERAK